MPTSKTTARTDRARADHPEVGILQQFAEGGLSGSEAMQVANHLMIGCSRCSTVLGRPEPGAEPSPSLPSGESRRLVDSLVHLPSTQAALRLENSVRLPAPEIAETLIEKVDSSEEDLDRPALLLLAAQALSRIGEPGDLGSDGREYQLEVLVAICRRLAQEARTPSEIRSSLEVFRRAHELADAGTPPLLQGRMLTACAALLEKASSPQMDLHEEISEYLPEADHKTALVRAHQLLALSGAHHEHAVCGLRLAEIALLEDGPSSPVAGLGDIAENLQLHIRQLDADADERLALIARRYLLAVQIRSESWSAAIETGRGLETMLESRGDLRGAFETKLERGRVHRTIGETAAARHCFLAARNGLLANGWVIDSAVATIELGLLALETAEPPGDEAGSPRGEPSKEATCSSLADQLTPLFACDGIEGESLAALLLLRESCLNGSVSPDELRECRAVLSDLLCAS